MRIRIVWLQPPMYPVNHIFFNILSQFVDLYVYQVGSHPNFKVEDDVFKEKKYNFKLINSYTYHDRRQNSPNFLKFLKIDKPDIVVSVAFWMPSFYLALSKKSLNFKLVITTDATSYTENNTNFIRKILRKFISNKTDLFIAASDYSKEFLNVTYNKTSVVTSRQTIDTSKWIEKSKKFSSDITLLKEQFKIPLHKTILLGVGRFEERKNWKKLIETISDLDENFYLILVGEGDLKEEYLNLIKYKNLEKKVSILPWMDNMEMIKVYSLSDIFIFPSLRDQFGFVVPEALSCGLPVICSDLVGAVEFIIEGENGFKVNANSDFTDKVKFIKSNLVKFSGNAVNTAKNYSLENRALEHYNFFKYLIHKNE